MNRNDEIMDEISDCLLDNKPLPKGYTVNVVSCEHTQYGWFGGFKTIYILLLHQTVMCVMTRLNCSIKSHWANILLLQ